MVRPKSLAALALTLAFTACATSAGPKGLATSAPKAGTKAGPQDTLPRALKSATKGPSWDDGLLTAIPHGAIAVVALGPRMGLQAMRRMVDEIPALKKELSDYLDQALGIDLVGHHHGGLAVIATMLQPQPELCLRVPLQGAKGRALTGKSAGQHRGVDLIALEGALVAALVDDALLLGSRRAVARVLDQRHGGKRSALAAKLQALVSPAPIIAAAVDLSAFGPATAAFGMRHATATVNEKYEVALQIEGDPAMMRRIPPLYAMGTGALITRMLHEKTMAKRGSNIGAGAAAIVSYHLSKKAIEEATPRLHEQSATLESHFKLPMLEGVGGLPLVGIMAAVAVPAFIKYLRKSKAAEAFEGIDKLKFGAKALFATGGARKLARLKNTPWTPQKPCCQQPGSKCAPDPGFATPTFRALRFNPGGAHRYQYRVLRTGRGKNLTLTIEARGDLDCDGLYSSFKLLGRVNRGALEFKGPLVLSQLE